MKTKKVYNSKIFNVWGLKTLLDAECYLILGPLVLFRQRQEEVEDLTNLVIDQYFKNITEMGLIKYYKQFFSEYIQNRRAHMRHADALNLISLSTQEYKEAVAQLPEIEQDLIDG